MKQCPGCGCQLEDNDMFCPECGTACQTDNSNYSVANTVAQASNASYPAKKKKSAILPVVLIVAAVLLLTSISAIIAVTVNNRKKAAEEAYYEGNDEAYYENGDVTEPTDIGLPTEEELASAINSCYSDIGSDCTIQFSTYGDNSSAIYNIKSSFLQCGSIAFLNGSDDEYGYVVGLQIQVDSFVFNDNIDIVSQVASVPIYAYLKNYENYAGDFDTFFNQLKNSKNIVGAVTVFDLPDYYTLCLFNADSKKATFGYGKEVYEAGAKVYREQLQNASQFPQSNAPENGNSSGSNRVRVVTSGSNLNVRSGPGQNYDIIGKIPNSTEVEVKQWGSDWTLINYNGLEGWVSSYYLANNS